MKKTLFKFKEYTVSIDPYQFIIDGPHRTKYTTDLSRVFEIIQRLTTKGNKPDTTISDAIKSIKAQQNDFLKEMKTLDFKQIQKKADRWWEELSKRRSNTA
jgi:hypothetical protein